MAQNRFLLRLFTLVTQLGDSATNNDRPNYWLPIGQLTEKRERTPTTTKDLFSFHPHSTLLKYKRLMTTWMDKTWSFHAIVRTGLGLITDNSLHCTHWRFRKRYFLSSVKTHTATCHKKTKWTSQVLMAARIKRSGYNLRPDQVLLETVIGWAKDNGELVLARLNLIQGRQVREWFERESMVRRKDLRTHRVQWTTIGVHKTRHFGYTAFQCSICLVIPYCFISVVRTLFIFVYG